MIDWKKAIKPLLSGNGASLESADAVNVANALVCNKEKILNHDKIHDNFYSLFVVLAGHALPTSFGNVHADDLHQFTSACQVISEYCISRLTNYDLQTHMTAVTQNHLVLVIKSLCGDHVFQRSDVITFIALIKSAITPMLVKNFDSKTSTSSATKETKPEMTPTADPIDLFSVFSIPVNDIDPGKDISLTIKQRNREIAQSLAMDHSVVKTFLELPYLKRYVTKHQTMMGAWKQGKFDVVNCATTEKDALVVAKDIFQLQKNLRLLKDATDPFITEPFDQNELIVNLDLVLGSLCAAVNVAVAVNVLQRVIPEPSEINQESKLDALHIVMDALDVCKAMSSSLEKSSHFGRNVFKNFHFHALIHLLHGLNSMTSVGFSPSKIFLGIGTLASDMLKDLLVDCNLNAWRYASSENNVDMAALADIMNTTTPMQQFQFIASKFPILQLMVDVSVLCFNAVHGQKTTLPQETRGSEQSLTVEKSNSEEAFSYYDDDDDDMEDATEDSPSDEENDEPMLGLWARKMFSDESPRETKSETALVPNSELPSLETNQPPRSKAHSSLASQESKAALPESMQDQFLQLMCCILKTVDDNLVASQVSWLKQYFCDNLTDKMIGNVADMMNEIDGDGIIISTEGISIMGFVHKMLSVNLFDPERRNTVAKLLLSRQTGKENQLFLGPLAASVFAQHLIQQQEIVKGSGDSTDVISFINSLVDHYQKCDGKEVQDVGVEMFQLAVFLFHTMTEQGREAFVLKIASAISSLEPLDCGMLSVTRLLLSFDCLLHSYSNPSTQLLHQVRWNFQAVCGLLSTEPKPKDRLMTTRERFDSSKLMFLFTQIVKPKENAKPKEKETKDIASLIFPIRLAKTNKNDSPEKSMQPALYELLQEPGDTFDEERGSIDEKALYVVLKDSALYNKLYTACVRSLEAGAKIKVSANDMESKPPEAVHWNAVNQYTFLIVWRLLKALPPSQAFEQICENGDAQTASEFLLAFHHITSKLDKDASTDSKTEKPEVTPKKVVMDEQLKQLVKLCENLTLLLTNAGSSPASEENTGDENAMVDLGDYPTTFQLMVMRCVLNQMQIQLWSKFIKSIDGDDPYDAMPLIGELLTVILGLVTKHASLCRSHILRLSLLEDTTTYSTSNKNALLAVMQCVDVDLKRVTSGAANIPLPLGVAQVLASWSTLRQELVVYTNTGKDTLNNCLHSHFKALYSSSGNTMNKIATISLLLLQDPLYLLCDDLVVWVRDSSSPKYSHVCDTLVPLLADVTCTDGYQQIKQALEKISGGPSGSDESSDTLNFYSLKGTYNILTNYINPESGIVNKSVAIKYLNYLASAMDDHSMQRAMKKFFVPEDFEGSKPADAKATKQSPDVSFKGKAANGKGSIVELMLTNRMLPSPDYSNQLLQFLAKLCKLANGENPHAQACLGPVCVQLGDFSLSPPEMREWVSSFDLNAVSSDGMSLRDDISSALLLLSQFILSENCPVDQKLALLLLDAILPADTSPEVATVSLQAMSPKFVSILATLAEAEKGFGHAKLLRYAIWWLDACAEMLKNEENSNLMHSQKENDVTRAVATCSTFLIYVGNLLSALKTKLADASEPTEEGDSDAEELLDASYEQDGDFEEPDMDAGNEDESSQDEEGLWNKLCTYTITQKKFMNQHWYHCHTCEMVDGVGVCTICAKVCHKGHDLSYAKFGSFFCDCGAKENKSCKALVKRVPGSDRLASGVSAFSDTSRPASSSTSASNVVPTSTSSSATSQKNTDSKAATVSEQAASTAAAVAQKLQNLGATQKPSTRTPRYVTGKSLCVDTSKDELLKILNESGSDGNEELPPVNGVVATLLKVLGVMQSVVHTDHYKLNSASSTLRALKAMEDLHKLQKPTAVVDTLMVPTLGSQEGAFENVKANFTGEQGQTIRQLINARYIRRVAMCCLATASGRRQHLAVSHERTKVTLLQLSALLKQANVSKRKLTLTRLSTTAMPFSVTTITANPSNEEALAVCGLKDCHVLTFASTSAAVVPSGSVTQHLVLHPQLATNNYIIRAVWLPASPCMLALVTADFIKIYDLAKDILSPCFYLLLPTGKIRDATFIGGMQSDDQTRIVVMSSTGYIYTQMLNDESLAVHGTFYLTDVLTVNHEHLKESGGQVGGGGISMYYSHSLKLLFFSYGNGKNFAASLDSKLEKAATLFQIEYKASNGGGSGGSGRNGSNALYEWSEVVNHTGLIFSFSQSQGCPVVVMVEPDQISMQEIKGVSAKAKIQDLVAVRHAGSSATPKEPGERTTIIVLCEDGSLRIYLASDEHTGFWLQPKLQPTTVLGSVGSSRKKQAAHSSKATEKEGEPEEVSFPIDFFEHCQVFNNNDIEFGGDPLQVYNTAQIKNRLNSTGMYIMDKSIFAIKIINKSSNMVITGLRVLVGSKGPLTAPTSFYIDQRYVGLGPRITRPRWFDLPLTRAESIAYNTELVLTCGPSEHPDDHNIVDSIKVYGKTKEAFGWPQDEPTAGKSSSATGGSKQASKPVATSNGSDAESDISGASQSPATANVTSTGVADEFLQSCLIALNNAFFDKFKESKEQTLHEMAVSGTSDLLTEPLSSRLYLSVKCLMKKLFTTKAECYQFMDEVLVKHAAEELKNEESGGGNLIDEDSFQRCLYHLSTIARRRPYNLTALKLSDVDDVLVIDLEATDHDEVQPKSESVFHETLLRRIMCAFRRLLANKPRSKLLVPSCLPGLTRVEMTVKIIIDIIHAITASVPSTTTTANDIYYNLLSHANSRVSYAAKTALIRLLRVKSDQQREGGGSVMRSCSKSSDTPPSTRSASPPSVESSQAITQMGTGQGVPLALGVGRGGRLAQVLRNGPGSHISSHATGGGTIYDDDDDDDDDDEDDDDNDDDEDDGDNDDDDENDNYVDLGADDVAIAIDEQLRHQEEEEDMEIEQNVIENDQRFFEEMLPDAGPDAAEEYARLFGHNEPGPPEDGNRGGERMAESRSLAIDVMRAMAAEAENGAVNMDEHNNLENMLMRMDFPNLLPPDVEDDEAMVEYAIALSLQQQERQEQQHAGAAPANNNPPEQAAAQAGRSHTPSEDGSSSASDAGEQLPDINPEEEELREISHEEQEEIKDQKERDAECLEEDRDRVPPCRRVESAIGVGRLSEMRIALLWDLFQRIEEVKKIGGEKCIPYFQVLSTLISGLNFSEESHISIHRRIVTKIVEELNGEMKTQESENSIAACTPSHEVFVVMMRLLSVMMSKSHTIPSNKDGDGGDRGEFPTTIYQQTTKILAQLGIKDLCFNLLGTLYKDEWKSKADAKRSSSEEAVTPSSTSSLLKSVPHPHATDMSPFFLQQYVQSHAGIIFQPYLRLITEMALNLAYQVRKTYTAGGADVASVFGADWRHLLSDFMLFADMPSLVKRRARKLLLYITGSKDKYREERDLHALHFYMNKSRELCEKEDALRESQEREKEESSSRSEFNAGLNLTYNDLIKLVDKMKKSCDIAESRVRNWQKYCISDPSCLPFLLNTSVRAEENVASSTLKLLLAAVSTETTSEKSRKLTKSSSKVSVSSSKASKDAKSSSSGDVALSKQLSLQILANITDSNLVDFFRHFLLEMNSASIRWSAHALALSLFRNTDPSCQLRLVNTLWQLCSQAPSYGVKAAQFIDLLGYLSMNLGLKHDAAKAFTDATMQVLQRQNRILSNHQNAILYSQLANYVQFDGFFLESNPCLVCNQLETPLTNIKLSSIKSDTRYTTTQQITKLVGSYAIQKVTIKVTDIKRTKMIRTAVMYYNNKRVPAIVDLKNNPSMWHRAKSVTVPQGENEIRFDLPLPVVATNLMLEFTDFYENVSASIETLQCPRCSASVQANPGICSNCGENVFQCHKCRSINYDEKDPFLCNVCGFSKYAKFDISVTARQCCAVDSIENDEDRKKMVASVVTLLEKADNVYNQLNAHKPQLEALLLQISRVSLDAAPTPDPPLHVKKPKGQPVTLNNAAAPPGGANASVSSSIQQLAKKYCQECKTLFEELSSIMRTVLASRSEIVEYDRRQQSAVSGMSTDAGARHVASSSGAWSQSAPDCYGCASASAQQCVTLLRVLATNEHAKPLLVASGIIRELIMYNLRRGNAKSRKQVHSLISQLITDNKEASLQLNELLLSRITGAISHHGDDLPPAAVACEMQLLTSMLEVRDNQWQLRLRAVMQLFQMSVKIKSPAVVENITLPCVHMLRKMVSTESKEGPPTSSSANISVEAAQWMGGLQVHSFDSWATRRGKSPARQATKAQQQQQGKNKKEVREFYLMEKYAAKWRDFVLNKKKLAPQKVELSRHSFLRTMLFCPTSRSMRQAACDVITSLAKNTSRKPQVLDLLTSYLDQLGNAGEAAAEFLTLYQEQIRHKQWRVYLASRGLLPLLGSLIQMEISKLSALEEKTLNLHLQQGYALKELTELLSEMVQVQYVRQHFKSKLVGTVLNSYLSLRRLVIQRTNLVDDAQDILLELLEELTTGTESETRSFMAVCIEAIKKQDTSDLKTPQFIFERLANIIYPEENDTSEFFLSLDKDPLQEDFLQGRMVGNPYSSNEAGLGPLMRDVKNKICRDCDLIALLEDDSGMELLINNKIIALDLPVRDVYKKIWLPNHTEDDAMHVVYRMRGLLGEATEDIVERLDSDKTDQNDEEVYKLASVLSECGGLEVMLTRLESVKSLVHGRQLVEVILKLLSHAIKLKVNRQYLARPQLNTLNILLGSLNLGLQAGEDGVSMVEQLLKVMGSVLQEASAEKTKPDVDSKELTGDKEKLTLLLQQIDSEFVQGHTSILQGILRIIPFLSFGDPDLMQLLIDHFISTLDFEKYDGSHSDDETIYLNCFCEIVSGIHFNASGNQLKDLMVQNKILQNATSYLNAHIPTHKNFESEDWKAFTSRPSVPFCLRMLTGLCTKYSRAQELVGEVAIPALHRLEQISSEESIGPHAENVLEALQEHPEVAKRIREVRRQTKDDKKKKAMAIRQKQLGSLGMKTNDKGQVITKSAILQQISDLVEETGLTCIICREGYKFEPKKVLGIYTYTRRCPLDEFEQKARKTQGYSTVSHFNIVHYECHTSAVRMARGREEWDSALLQNTNTKCNGLLPLWGAQVPEAAFASCLARHNTYIQEATGQREPGFYSTVHDLKLLLSRFANERSFSEETGGGGRQSNINLIPYLIHAGLYVVNSTRNQEREERTVSEFLSAPVEKWLESSYDLDGPLYVASVVPFIHGSKKWNEVKITFLKRLLVVGHARKVSLTTISKLADREVKEFSVYKPYVLFWALVNLIITVQFKNVPEDGGCSVLANYIRHNDTQLLETGEKTLSMFQDEVVVCESFDEFVDVLQLHEDIGCDPTTFIKQTLDSLPA